MDNTWNPWHGCTKYSEGCLNCYVYRRDESVGRDASVVTKTADFDLPVRRGRGGGYKIPPGSSIFCCMTSDFFLDAADEWRRDAWRMMHIRSGVHFSIITKRILRAGRCLPPDWGDGYDNVSIGCTAESQAQADRRLPAFLDFPARHKFLIAEPILTAIDFSPYLDPDRIESVTVGGESGPAARVCRYEWVLSIASQCRSAGVPFHFKQTGENFSINGRHYRVPRREIIHQAHRAGIDWPSGDASLPAPDSE